MLASWSHEGSWRGVDDALVPAVLKREKPPAQREVSSP